MPASQMKELLKHELGDLLYAEQRILQMLRGLQKEVSSPEMLARLKEHTGETEEQIERLKRAFATIGEKPKAEKCDGIIGLREEHDSFKREEKPSRVLLEAFDLGSGLRVEHYEIAAYRSAMALATALGYRETVGILAESLSEEEAMAKFIERSSVKQLKLLGEMAELEEARSQARSTNGKAPGRSSAKSGGSARSSSGKSSGSGSRSTASKSGGSSKSNGSGGRSTAGKPGSGGRGKAGGGSSRSGSSART
ncbi:MAG TPA: ferritin-like domain-containing protein [Longimicrobium sp.]|nr:ferritin-like domain-containing protein [Longimicrobium sp.]